MQELVDRINEALVSSKDVAREILSRLWIAHEENGHLEKCIIAHYMADACAEIAEELKWDKTAYDELDNIVEEEINIINLQLTKKAFSASICLNLSNSYFKNGDSENARKYVIEGIALADFMDDSGYADMVKSGLSRLVVKIEHAGWESEK